MGAGVGKTSKGEGVPGMPNPWVEHSELAKQYAKLAEDFAALRDAVNAAWILRYSGAPAEEVGALATRVKTIAADRDAWLQNANIIHKEYLRLEGVVRGRAGLTPGVAAAQALEAMGFEKIETGGGATAWWKRFANGREVAITSSHADSGDLDKSPTAMVCMYGSEDWTPENCLLESEVAVMVLERTAGALDRENLLMPTLHLGQRFDFDEGDRVIGNGFPGTVVGVGQGEAGRDVRVQLPGGRVLCEPAYPDCFPASLNGVEVVMEGQWLGPVREIGEQFVVQDVGRGRMVAHVASRLDTKPQLGKEMLVEYKDHRGHVRGDREPGRAVER